MPKSGNQMLRVGPIAAPPGERAEGYAELGEWPNRQPWHIPIAIVNGAQYGPVAYVQAVSDGDELNGIAVLQRILRRLRPERLRGALIAVPLTNIPAFLARRSENPVDGKKLNRCFPGRAQGTSSERIAYFLFREAVQQADFVIDLHQGGTGKMIDECRVRVNQGDRAGPASFELGRVFGSGFILHQRGPDGQLARAAPAQGIPAIDPELGGACGWDESSIRKGVRGVLNVFRHFGMIEGQPRPPKRQVVCRALRPVLCRHGGLRALRKPLGALMKRGEVFAEILDPFGGVVEEIRSPAHAVLWAYDPHPGVASGQRVATLGLRPTFI